MPMEQGKLGGTIRRKRMEAQLTQEELAEMVGITATHMKHLESEHRAPSIEVLFRLVETLHISLDELLLPKPPEDSQAYRDALSLLGQCNEGELRIAGDLLRSLLRNR